MKIAKFMLVLISLIYVQAIGYCNSQKSGNLLEKIYWEGSSPSAVAAQANKMQSLNPSASPTDDGQAPMLNPMGAYGSMFQMMNTDSYNTVEMQRQQADYVKQQVQN